MTDGINSFHYWTLNPDQATSDPMKSPADPIAMVQEALVDSNETVNLPLGGDHGDVNAVESSEKSGVREGVHSSVPTGVAGEMRPNDSAV